MSKEERQKTMHRLDEGICVCAGCPLHASRAHAVPDEGPVPADVFIIGEAPGAKEDKLGRPFVGPSGMILERSLEAAAIRSASVMSPLMDRLWAFVAAGTMASRARFLCVLKEVGRCLAGLARP